jgi:hypothetical protein
VNRDVLGAKRAAEAILDLVHRPAGDDRQSRELGVRVAAEALGNASKCRTNFIA